MHEENAQCKNNVNIKRLDSDYQDLIENIKGKTVARYPKKSLKIRKVHSLLDEEYLDYILNSNFAALK
ncbi:hypothetical protein [Petroclostridium xylanilyticum]|jgi:hypothetical protein|uniref:hypothetical protein n=1 Tax=Petroclostridium xylanilyticum TaxID=1792311 RepID=UPI000B9885E3|nr:hypothetical protein [Petroclostridium xylanilyticum]